MLQSSAPQRTPSLEGMVRDPYPIYAALRETGPVVWSDEARGGAWLITRYADIAAALQDPRLSAERTDVFTRQFDDAERLQLAPILAALGRWLLFMDLPGHSRLRKAMNRGFKPAVLEALRPGITELVDELLQPLFLSGARTERDCGSAFDFVREFAHPLPARVIAGMLGVPGTDQRRFIAWSDDVVALVGTLDADFDSALRAQHSMLAMKEYFRGLLTERRAAAEERVDVPGVMQPPLRGGVIATEEVLIAQWTMFFFAGHETTRNLLGNGLYALLTHPDQATLLRANPELMPRALRELVRYDSPVQFTGRRALEDLTLHGRTIRRGDNVLLMLGSGNRDPARFTDPDRLDLTRDEGPSLSFGYGPHVCIGATLSYLEAGIAFSRLMPVLSGMHCLDPTPQWVDNPAFRGLRRLRLGLATGRSARMQSCFDPEIRTGTRDGSGPRSADATLRDS